MARRTRQSEKMGCGCSIRRVLPAASTTVSYRALFQPMNEYPLAGLL